MPWLKTAMFIVFQPHFVRTAPTNLKHAVPITGKSGRYWYNPGNSLLPAITTAKTIFYADIRSGHYRAEGKDAFYEDLIADY